MRILLLSTIALFAGCQSLDYRGASPNVRTFSEDPSTKQYYIGFDFEFALLDEPDDSGPKPAAPSVPQLPIDEEDLPRELPDLKFLQ